MHQIQETTLDPSANISSPFPFFIEALSKHGQNQYAHGAASHTFTFSFLYPHIAPTSLRHEKDDILNNWKS